MSRAFLVVLPLFLALGACMAPTGPIEVTRFHAPDLSALGKGTISVEPAAGIDPASLEWRTYQGAVLRELVRLGYQEAPAGQGAQVAQLRLKRHSFRPERSGSPVSVGIGGSTGSYGTGLGIGIGLNLAGQPKERVATELGVLIKDRASDTALWEGRASFTVRAGSPLADTALGAPKMAGALFAGFPGKSGETIAVK